MLKNNNIKIVKFGVLFFICFCFLSGCSSQKKEDLEKPKVTIGSKSFTESNLLAELYALALEENGFLVERKFNIAGSVIHQAITQKEIDIYPEYTGSGLISILKGPFMTDPKEVFDYVSKEYKEKFSLIWLMSSDVNDGQGLVIRTDQSEKYQIKTISDLQKNASELHFASQGDFDEREDGLPALEKVYGPFSFASNTVYDDSLKYDILRNQKADVAVAYTTEGALTEDTFTLLEDDKKAWPPYYASPVIRKEVLDQYPQIETILNQVSQCLTTKDMTSLNAKVDLEKKEAEETALEYYQNKVKQKETKTTDSQK